MSVTEESVILRRARKLLRLSKSANENEATLAAEKLQEMCLRYNIALHQVSDDPKRTEVRQDLVYTAKRKSSWRGVLAMGIGKAYLVFPIWTRDCNLIFAGNPDNLGLAVEVFFYLEETIYRLSEKFLKEEWRYSPKAEAESYKLGMATRIARRLKEKRKEMEERGLADQNLTDTSGELVTSECTALVVFNAIKKVEKSNADFIAAKYGTVTRGRSTRASRESAYNRGFSDGGSVGLNPNKKIGGGQGLLTG